MNFLSLFLITTSVQYLSTKINLWYWIAITGLNLSVLLNKPPAHYHYTHSVNSSIEYYYFTFLLSFIGFLKLFAYWYKKQESYNKRSTVKATIQSFLTHIFYSLTTLMYLLGNMYVLQTYLHLHC